MALGLHWSLELASLTDHHLWLLPVSLGVVGGGLGELAGSSVTRDF